MLTISPRTSDWCGSRRDRERRRVQRERRSVKRDDSNGHSPHMSTSLGSWVCSGQMWNGRTMPPRLPYVRFAVCISACVCAWMSKHLRCHEAWHVRCPNKTESRRVLHPGLSRRRSTAPHSHSIVTLVTRGSILHAVCWPVRSAVGALTTRLWHSILTRYIRGARARHTAHMPRSEG